MLAETNISSQADKLPKTAIRLRTLFRRAGKEHFSIRTPGGRQNLAFLSTTAVGRVLGAYSICMIADCNDVTLKTIYAMEYARAWESFYYTGLPAFALMLVANLISSYSTKGLELSIENAEMQRICARLNSPKMLRLFQEAISRRGLSNISGRIQEAASFYAQGLVASGSDIMQAAFRSAAILYVLQKGAQQDDLFSTTVVIGSSFLLAAAGTGASVLIAQFRKLRRHSTEIQSIGETFRRKLTSIVDASNSLKQNSAEDVSLLQKMLKAVFKIKTKVILTTTGMGLFNEMTAGTAAFITAFPVVVALIEAYHLDPSFYGRVVWPASLLADNANLAKSIEAMVAKLRSGGERLFEARSALDMAEIEAARHPGITLSRPSQGVIALSNIRIEKPFVPAGMTILSAPDMQLQANHPVAVTANDKAAALLFIEKLADAVEALPAGNRPTMAIVDPHGSFEDNAGATPTLRTFMTPKHIGIDSIDPNRYVYALKQSGMPHLVHSLDATSDIAGSHWPDSIKKNGATQLAIAGIFLADKPPDIIILNTHVSGNVLENIVRHAPDSIIIHLHDDEPLPAHSAHIHFTVSPERGTAAPPISGDFRLLGCSVA